MYKIKIIGGGLSALYAYYGCLDEGYSPDDIVVSINKIPKTYGAVFMYESPVKFTPVKVMSSLMGTCEQYAKNQWGDPRIETSVIKRFNGGTKKVVYEDLYDPYVLAPALWRQIKNIEFTEPMTDDDVDAESEMYEAVICTFPRKNTLAFASRLNMLTEIPIYFAEINATAYHIVYNGTTIYEWVRRTLFPGKIFVEYPTGFSSEEALEISDEEEVAEGKIHMVTDLKPNCRPISLVQRSIGNQVRVGRMSALKPGYLSHHSRQETRIFLKYLKKKEHYDTLSASI